MSSIDQMRAGDRLLSRMLTSFQQFQKLLADRTGLNTTDLTLFGVLETAGVPLTAGALAQAADLTSGATTTAIDRLEAAGIVQRQRSEEDRRAVLVALRQPNARKLLKQIGPLRAAREQLWGDFNERERETITRFLAGSIEMVKTWTVAEKGD